MASEQSDVNYIQPLKRLLVAISLIICFVLLILWRIDSPRVERFRANIADSIVPNMSWLMVPVTGTVELFRDFRSYRRVVEHNDQLRRELRQMQSWKEAALQLEQENARLLDLNRVQLDPQLTYITGVVLADAGSPFRQSVLVNVGARDGILEGWATMDGLGLVGRVAGVGANSARVILLTDTSSRVAARIEPSGQSAIISGDNSNAPIIDFVENPGAVRPGDRIVTSGDGRVFPPGLLIGRVTEDPGGRLRVGLSADYERLKFLRVLRKQRNTPFDELPELLLPQSDNADLLTPGSANE